MMLAMRTLLAERFKLAVHRETRQLDNYALNMVKPGQPGPALKPANDEDCSPAALAARRGGPPPAPGTPFPVCGIQQGRPIRFGGYRSRSSHCRCRIGSGEPSSIGRT